ncbi:MAG: fibronectin type III domain-containing protein [Patescibacteria group bacterium]|nr:fibronectin type III domain-containing protein [Patescibacteria group bacterium]
MSIRENTQRNTSKKIFFLVFLVFFILCPVYKILAREIIISEVNVFNFVDGRASVEWNTNIDTKGEIYYGKSREELSYFMGYSLYDISHESSLSGLEEDETYYFKIIAIDIFGNRSESFIQTFDTDDMVNTIPPEIIKSSVIQVTWDAVMISWTTNKKTKAEIQYGKNSEDNLTKKTSYGSYDTDHVKVISGLTPNTRYFMKVIAKDKSGNSSNIMLIFNTNSVPNAENRELKITNIEPINDTSLISGRYVRVKFKTNWASKAQVYYGTKSTSLKKSLKDERLSLDHEVIIDDLEPNTQYYFEVKAYDTFYNKSKTSGVLGFRTKKLETNFKTGDIVKGSSSLVYIIQGNNKAWIENENIFNGLGYKWNMIKEADDITLARYNDIKNISNTKRHPDGSLIKYDDSSTVYLIENKKKRPFYTGEVFESAGYNWNDVITINKKKWSYSTGDTIY